MKQLTFLHLLIFFAACTETAKTKPEKLASAACTCLANSAIGSLNQEAEKAMSNKTLPPETLQNLLQAIAIEHQKLELCLKPAITGFGQLTADQLPKFEQEVKTLCPNQEATIQGIIKPWLLAE
jgi:hypothetical protein